MYNVVVAFRAQAYAAYGKMLLNPFKITSSARPTTAEILNDQKQTLSDFKIDLLSAPHCIIQSHLTMNSSRRKLLNMMRPRKVFTVLKGDRALVYYSVYGEGKFFSVDLGLNANSGFGRKFRSSFIL